MHPALISPAAATWFGIPLKVLYVLIPLARDGRIRLDHAAPHRAAAQGGPRPALRPHPGAAAGGPQDLARAVAPPALPAGRGAAHRRLLRLPDAGRPLHPVGDPRVRGRLHPARVRRRVRERSTTSSRTMPGPRCSSAVVILAIRRARLQARTLRRPRALRQGPHARGHPRAGAHRHADRERRAVRREPRRGRGCAGAAGHPVPPLTLVWVFHHLLAGASTRTLQALHLAAYTLHDLVFFFFLCFLPLGKHFHVITSLFNVFFMRLETGNVKPVRHGVDESKLDELKSFGVKKFEDFTWKHMLDFYSCADCGRCSDHCPANRVKRPLSPRFISIKARDYGFRHYPLRGAGRGVGAADRRHLHRGRDLVLHHLRRLRAGVPGRDRVHRQDGRPAPRHGGRGHGAAVAAEAAQGPREARQPLGQDGEEARRLDGRGGSGLHGQALRERRGGRDPLLRRQHHLLRRPHAEDRPGDRAHPLRGRGRLRRARQGREGQRPRGAALRRGDALPDA